MAFAPARVAPAVAQRLQIPVQVLLYVGLFIFAQYLVNRWQVPLPANLVGMVMLLLLIVCRVIPVSWVPPREGAGFGAASHGAGTARSYELGQQEGVVASLVMMLSGVVVVLAAPVVRWLLF
ncbi:LrgB family protein [Klebsiella pneumoniae]|uniref:LrgB family protein n=1 Tax=Klebsiella pneumoniae TaxID=573 RepID=UPI00287B6387|nr:LrgB family protein [Klebsiella pneumoniae]